jgi:hypothetical protein
MFRKELALMAMVCALCACNLEAEEVYGDLYNPPGRKIEVHGGGMDVYGSVFNRGTVFIVPFGTFWAERRFENYGLIEMYNGECASNEVFKNFDTGEIRGYGVVDSVEDIHNRGLLRSLGGPLLVCSGAGFSNTGILVNGPGTSLTIVVEKLVAADLAGAPLVDNYGIIEVASDGSVVFDCNLVNEPNGVLKLLGGTLAAKTVTQKAGATLEGFGGITGDLVIEPNAVIKLTGPTNVVGDVKITEGGTLEIRDGAALVTGRVICNGTIHLKGGYIIPQGVLSASCNIIWEPGIYTNVADFNLDGRVNLKDFALFADTWLWQAKWR